MDKGELTRFPDVAGVYAIYDGEGALQYVGVSRKIGVSVTGHMQDLPDSVKAVKFFTVGAGTREELSAKWKSWVEEHVSETGQIPPGNMPGETKWQSRTTSRAKPEIRLTAGKSVTVPIEQLIDQVVKDNKIVAFVKGTRTQPQCGFSHKMMTILNDANANFEVVNVLDEFHNPGLRDAIKSYSQWPTIPQLYVKGEFVGGADIVEEMAQKGELLGLLAEVKK